MCDTGYVLFGTNNIIFDLFGLYNYTVDISPPYMLQHTPVAKIHSILTIYNYNNILYFRFWDILVSTFYVSTSTP